MSTTPKNATLPRMGVTFKEKAHSSNYGTTGRPLSYYDNISKENRQTPDQSNLQLHPVECECQEWHHHQVQQERSPTQAPLLNTTVPQKIGNETIGGRHEPTRNSLRHSRMIVLGRNGQPVPNHPTPHIIQSHKLGKALVGLQTLLGAAIVTFSLWLLLWAPSIRTRDNPYWSGLPLLISGVVGLILLCCCSKECLEVTEGYVVNGFKLLNILISTVAGISCFIACAFAIIHLISLATMECAPVNQLNATCFCKVPSYNDSSLLIKSYHYVDLNCPEVNHILTILIISSCSTNFLGGIIASWYVYLHWASRYNSYRYSRVRTKESRSST